VYGNEDGMILFNILTYSVCDLWFGDTVISILLTYLLMEFIMLFRRSYGHDNLGSKTLVDSRFLLYSKGGARVNAGHGYIFGGRALFAFLRKTRAKNGISSLAYL
jgi:hypothetical protein